MMKIEKIRQESQDKYSWICIWGNKPTTDGFYACDKNGFEMEPEIGSNWKGLYVCAICNRVINQNNL
jgi:hypothetical protein